MNLESLLAWSGSNIEKMCKTETTRSSISFAFLLEGFDPVRRSRSRNFGERLDQRLWTVFSSCRSSSEPSRTDLRSASPTNLCVSSFALRSVFILAMSVACEVEGCASSVVSMLVCTTPRQREATWLR